MTLSSQEPTLTVFPAGIQVVNDPIIPARVTVATLPAPADHLGGIIYTTDGGLRLSDGTQWLTVQTGTGSFAPPIAGTVFTAFQCVVQNLGGTLQHNIGALNVGSTTPTVFDAAVSGASTTKINTPSGTNASTAFANGVKIDSANLDTLILDTADLADLDSVAVVTPLMETDQGQDLVVRPQLLSVDVNGVTRTRLHVNFRNAGTNAGRDFNTTNYATNQFVRFGVYGFMPAAA